MQDSKISSEVKEKSDLSTTSVNNQKPVNESSNRVSHERKFATIAEELEFRQRWRSSFVVIKQKPCLKCGVKYFNRHFSPYCFGNRQCGCKSPNHCHICDNENHKF